MFKLLSNWLFKAERKHYEAHINTLKRRLADAQMQLELNETIIEDLQSSKKITLISPINNEPIRNISTKELHAALKELHPNDMYLYFKDGELSQYDQGRTVGRLEVIDQIEALLYDDENPEDEDEQDGNEERY